MQNSSTKRQVLTTDNIIHHDLAWQYINMPESLEWAAAKQYLFEDIRNGLVHTDTPAETVHVQTRRPEVAALPIRNDLDKDYRPTNRHDHRIQPLPWRFV